MARNSFTDGDLLDGYCTMDHREHGLIVISLFNFLCWPFKGNPRVAVVLFNKV